MSNLLGAITILFAFFYDIQQQKFGPHIRSLQLLYLCISRLSCSTTGSSNGVTQSNDSYTCKALKHVLLKKKKQQHIFENIYSAETQSGLPLLPWSCYASVIQCDIIQYLLFLFYYNTGIISFLAIYNDTIL